MKIRPDIQQLLKVGDSRFANSITAGQVEALLAGNSKLVLTGVVISDHDTGERFIVDNAITRWLDRNDWHTLLNPPRINSKKPILDYKQ